MLYIRAVTLVLFTLFVQVIYATTDIDDEQANEITSYLRSCKNESYYLFSFSGYEDIVIRGKITWDSDCNLVLQTPGNIVFKENARIISNGEGSVLLKSGINPLHKEYTSGVIFEGGSPQIIVKQGKVKVYYNPQKGKEKHKHHNYLYNYYSKHIDAPDISNQLFAYMLVNDINDLQDVVRFLHGEYALSQDIDASQTREWGCGSRYDEKRSCRGFRPLKHKSRSFSGNFDGNGFVIKNLFINLPNEKEVGLFGRCRGFEISHNIIENLVLENFDIDGDHYVGSLVGAAINCDLSNIKVINPEIKSRDVVGGLIGTAYHTNAKHIILENVDFNKIEGLENRGRLVGGIGSSSILLEDKDGACNVLTGNDDGNIALNCIDNVDVPEDDTDYYMVYMMYEDEIDVNVGAAESFFDSNDTETDGPQSFGSYILHPM